MSKTVSEIIVDTLQQAGARRVWGIVGDTINHFTDAVRESDLRWLHVRHEEVGGFAAGAEAYATGELAVCAGTCGPGSLHFVNGIYESHRNGAPVVMIATDVARSEVGLGFPQEVDQRKVYEQCSVFCEYISHPDQARRITAMAAQAALNERGVAVVIVNGDMFPETPDDDLAWSVHRPAPVIRPSDADLQRLAEAVNEAQKVTIYAGIGARGSGGQVVELARKLNAPVVHSTRAKEFIEPDNPNNVGMTGILGNGAGLKAIEACDLMLCLGSDFAYTQFWPDKAKVIQIDTDATHLGRRAPVHMGLVGDVGATLDALMPKVEAKEDDAHLATALDHWKDDRETYEKRGREHDADLIHPQFVTQMLDRLAKDDAAFTADGGSPMVWALRHLTATRDRSFLISLLHGTMANAYPQAMGLAAAYEGRQVIAMCGDGGLTMLLGDLLTLRQEKLPVKIIVYNNGSLAFVEMEQRVEGLLDAYTDLENPDFAELARVCGIAGHKATSADDLEAAMTAWLAEDGPALLDEPVNSIELVMPPEVEPGQVLSTALFGAKAVTHGRIREVVSLLRDNFLR
ncbi:ubiquinone-dependent pyruvate dehydrogenase [Roseovarius sp. SCSIO 43702]|uniref:thiamine pyrophosphate-dependent enzyme n=1 Tax=Roseovarius sp. SCSIO 43702 TaxID=2823043 RepID=UPI001C733206|nr:thiamine pyrophosphate-dependent enzyme [Roseovarius sp. SCSIO 43702]QYX56001.1 ubiquinone-dependent pyruvate dehydrogenase [Roseovarius sp. SCSIO 43702]